jgi:hypothetical protein
VIKGPVPVKDVPRFRRLMTIAELLETTGNLLGNEFYLDSMTAYALASRYEAMANGLREDRVA